MKEEPHAVVLVPLAWSYFREDVPVRVVAGRLPSALEKERAREASSPGYRDERPHGRVVVAEEPPERRRSELAPLNPCGERQARTFTSELLEFVVSDELRWWTAPLTSVASDQPDVVVSLGVEPNHITTQVTAPSLQGRVSR